MADKVKTSIEIDADARKAIRALDDVADAATDAQTAVDKVDGTDVTVDTDRAIAGLDDVEAAGKRLAAQTFAVDVDVDPTKIARTGDELDRIGRSADSSKSVLANMVGNASQDLGQLGGVAGSAGVAIGQMGEYMADAVADGDKLTNVMKNFAAVAGPIALLSAAVSVVTGLLGEQAAKAEAAEKRTKAVGDAMAETADDSVGLTRALRDSVDQLRKVDQDPEGFFGKVKEGLRDVARQLPLVGAAFDETFVDTTVVLDKVGLSLYDLARGARDNAYAWDVVRAAMFEAHAAGRITDDEFAALSNTMEDHRDAVEQAARVQRLFNVDQQEANALLQELLMKQAPLEHFTDTWRILFDDMADGTIDTQAAADAVNVLAEKLGLTRDEVLAIAQGELDKEFDDAAGAANRLKLKLDELDQRWDRLRDKFARRDLLDAAKTGFDDLRTKAVAAWDAAERGADDADDKLREYNDAQRTQRDLLIDVGDQIDALPDEQVTRIVTLIDQGKLDEAEWLLAELTKPKTTTVKVRLTNQYGTDLRFDEYGNVRPATASPAPAASTPRIGVVNVHMPRTASARDLAGVLDRWAGVNG